MSAEIDDSTAAGVGGVGAGMLYMVGVAPSR